MKEMNMILEQYKESQFYEKYKDTYYSDIILRDVFKCNLNLHKLRLKNKTYGEIQKKNVEMMTDFIELFVNNISVTDESLFWQMLYAFYIDPDSKGVKMLEDIECTADGLFSIKRIYSEYGMTEKMVREYEKYRKMPIFFFPTERGGINTSRASAFGDRIDYTLFDLKKYFEEVKDGNIDNCKLANAYRLPETHKWLRKIGSFENLVDWYGIKGIFVDADYNVFDVEKGNGECIYDYALCYGWKWSSDYYGNLKKIVDRYQNNNK